MARVAIPCIASLLFAFGLALSLDAADDGPVLEGDYDGDGIPDEVDNCIYTWNGLPDAPVPPPQGMFCFYQVDSDLDGFGDACDTDYNQDSGNGMDDCSALLSAALGQSEYDPAMDSTATAGSGSTTSTPHSGGRTVSVPRQGRLASIASGTFPAHP